MNHIVYIHNPSISNYIRMQNVYYESKEGVFPKIQITRFVFRKLVEELKFNIEFAVISHLNNYSEAEVIELFKKQNIHLEIVD